jgi:hypothetical protein
MWVSRIHNVQRPTDAYGAGECFSGEEYIAGDEKKSLAGGAPGVAMGMALDVARMGLWKRAGKSGERVGEKSQSEVWMWSHCARARQKNKK